MNKLTKEEFVIKYLSAHVGYGNELTSEEEQIAKDSGLVVIYGYSDDNVELRGAINDEVGAYNGTEFYINKDGVLPECECICECRKCCVTDYREEIGDEIIATAKEEYTWFIETKLPHATFEVFDDENDGEKFCRGIVVDLDDLKL